MLLPQYSTSRKRYQNLQDDSTTRWNPYKGRPDRKLLLHRVVIATMFVGCTLIFMSWALRVHAGGGTESFLEDVDVDWSTSLTWKNWAQYSPYTPLAVYSLPPDGCVVSQVNIIQRHGARFPTSGAATRIRAALEKLSNATDITDNRLQFLSGYQYDLGQDDLVPFGALQ